MAAATLMPPGGPNGPRRRKQSPITFGRVLAVVGVGLVLAALIVRPVAFKYRSKRDGAAWRARWDWALFAGGAVPALLFGVAVGNVMLGVPFHLTDDLMPMYDGNFAVKFLGLLRPFALLAGVVSISMLLMHGAAWLNLKTEGLVAARARRFGVIAGLVAASGYALAGLWLALGIDGFSFVNDVAPDGPSNPLYSEVARTATWLTAYADRPWIAAAPLLGLAGMAMAVSNMARCCRVCVKQCSLKTPMK